VTKTLLTLALLIASAPVRADWSPAAREWARRHDAGPAAFSNGVESTLWGGVRAAKYSLHEKPELDRTTLPSTWSASGRLPVCLKLQPRAARLLVFVSGIFSDGQDPRNRRSIARFAGMGFHVLSIPNSLSPEFLEHAPRFVPGAALEEGMAGLELVDRAVERIGPEQVTGVELVGESYGGFQAAVMLALDAASARPRFTGTATLLSPPFSAGTSIRRLDDAIERTAELARGRCRFSKIAVPFLADFASAEDESQLNPRWRECAETVAAWFGFQRHLSRSVEAMYRATGTGLAPPEDGRKEWRDSLRFRHLIEAYSQGELDPYLTGALGLPTHWLERALAAGFPESRLRVLTAEDDFINDPGALAGDPFFAARPGMLISLRWGGHLGYEGLEDYFPAFLAGELHAKVFPWPFAKSPAWATPSSARQPGP
jgi:hypothetical protein